MSERLCLDCDADLAGKRADAQFCDGTCKKRWQRKQPKPKSHVAVLKEKVKARILGRAQGRSSTPKTEPPHGTDGPPDLSFMKSCEQAQANLADNLREASQGLPEQEREWLDTVADATAGLPPEALPDGERIFEREFISKMTLTVPPFTQLPVEHHGTQNDLARQIIAKVPAPKLDPNSEEAELTRLQKQVLRQFEIGNKSEDVSSHPSKVWLHNGRERVMPFSFQPEKSRVGLLRF